ncbi:hypothetical protein PIB30_072211 [Stylosanthes scabra]|uniref:Uncharacterized protein n=1 Tax=Stylosanthes scabra TaxID=79078 RepID=A0ABU6TNN7_9FABA|nr:hypothetical protein [Stylosanthes scabra]
MTKTTSRNSSPTRPSSTSSPAPTPPSPSSSRSPSIHPSKSLSSSYNNPCLDLALMAPIEEKEEEVAAAGGGAKISCFFAMTSKPDLKSILAASRMATLNARSEEPSRTFSHFLLLRRNDTSFFSTAAASALTATARASLQFVPLQPSICHCPSSAYRPAAVTHSRSTLPCSNLRAD